ncbi:Luc7-like protein 3 [Thelohanellus kitauei]|uniref:Luc7-like protein 3 n=1 Tax=Thelohanellus kitauei TaxID=669202 RepID=A0A0C2MU08_THEKT|nr:Luc7-like protein 3 [Thelohanellus kitauei]
MKGYSAADILDQLMGPNRNLAPGEKPKEVLHWSNPRVCKNFLCGFCPYELFTNTKADLGSCALIHEELLRNQYEASDEYGTMGYEESFYHFIKKILEDCERKIARGYERLKNRKPVFMDPADQDAYDKINEKMNEMLKKIEEMGTKGSVEEATYAMQDVEEMRNELNSIAQRSSTTTKFGYDREMEVCAVCGSLTLVNDLPSRFEDHLNGRQHVGFSKVRQQVKLMNDNKYWKKKSKKDEEEGKKDSSKRRKRSSSSSRSRSRSKERKSSKHAEKRRKRSRSTSRSPKRSSRSDRDRSPHRSRRRSHEKSSRSRRS